LQAIRPEMEAIKEEMNAMDPKSAKEGKAKMTALFQKYMTSLDYSYICFRGNARLRLFPS
jgi:hypothetical protein